MDHYPPGWHRWSRAVALGAEPSALGFSEKQARLNRFAARYRVASAFDTVKLTAFHPTTEAGYSSILRVALVWTAFEQYLAALNSAQDDCLSWFAQYLPANAANEVRALDPGGTWLTTMYAWTRKKNSEQIDLLLKGKPFNFTYLASSIRHLFFHGHLTPNARRADPAKVVQLCDYVARVHLEGLGNDFLRRLTAFEHGRAP
jgi:hypothetical protein